MDNQDINARLDRIERYSLLAAKQVLDIKDVALLLGKSVKTVRNRLDEIPHYYGGNGLAFRRSEIEEWMCQVKCTPQTI